MIEKKRGASRGLGGWLRAVVAALIVTKDPNPGYSRLDRLDGIDRDDDA